ncbi:MAG: twin-arginine translocase subunit TatC [Solirubrobacterales bacterium]|nr:twin-arginine translocase subunit TatC [Solirubrobacterales bacterium]MBV9807091.1 twin-arginine translocase subunit TatC [Solirubrobacterales bacterium]
MLRTLRRALGSVPHDERLSTVGHLDELRTRLIVSVVVIAVAFGLCFSQSDRLLRLIDGPLAHQTQGQVRVGPGPLGATYTVARAARDVAIQLHAVVGVLRRPDGGAPPAVRPALGPVSENLERDIARLSAPPQGDKPVTLGIGEPFTTTVTISFVFALILTSPLLLHQGYAFLAPALEPADRRRIRPLILAIPFLFVAGVLFGYFVVLPAAVHFFQNFNRGEFNVLVQAGPYYKFAATTVLAMGMVFEVPVAIVAVTRVGLVTPRRLRKNRRYAVAACGLVAAALPGDAVTMLLETVPLYLLFELGVLLASVTDRRARARAASVNLSSVQ